MSDVLVLYYSRYGAVREMARWVAHGVERVDPSTSRDLAHARAVKPEIHEHLTGAIEDLAAFRGILLHEPERGAIVCSH